MASNQAKAVKDALEMSPLKKKRDLKQTPTKPAKITNNEDIDNEDSCTKPRQLFEQDTNLVDYDPWLNVTLSPYIEEIIAEQKELRYTGPDLLPPNEPLFQGFVSPPRPKNHGVYEYSPKEAGMYLNFLDEGMKRGSPGNRRRICLEEYWQKVRLLPSGKTAVYQVCKKVKDGELVNDWWGQSGRLPLIPVARLKELASKHVSNSHGLPLKPQDVIDAAARYQADLAAA